MLKMQISDISEFDITQLVEDCVSEGRKIEYKEELPGKNDECRKEFLADISSFANCDGGHIIYGIKEEAGIPIEIKGVMILDEDAMILQFENLIRDALAPRINIEIRVIDINEKKVLIINVKPSWNKPHRITFKGYDKFFSRNSAGKYPLDVDQLRSAFLLSNEISDRIKNFVVNRISEIATNSSFVKLENHGKLAIFAIPIGSFSERNDYKILEQNSELRPPYCSGWNDRINLDGVLKWAPGETGTARSYVELYRNGIIEGVTSGLLSSWGRDEKFIPSSAYEMEILDTTRNYINTIKKIGVSPPIVVFYTFINIKNYTLGFDSSRFWTVDKYNYDRDILSIPEIIIDEYEVNLELKLRPCFDLVWNAFGFRNCPNFAEDGTYIRR